MNQSELIKVQNEIVRVNSWLAEFWSNSHGWAPYSAAELMSQSRLDNQVALSFTLKIWLEQEETQGENGRLILAWANLGALIEGTLKLFCVPTTKTIVMIYTHIETKKKNYKTPIHWLWENLGSFSTKETYGLKNGMITS